MTAVVLTLSHREKSFWERIWKSREFEMEKGHDSLASKHRKARQVTLPYPSTLTMSHCLWLCRVSFPIEGQWQQSTELSCEHVWALSWSRAGSVQITFSLTLPRLTPFSLSLAFLVF